MSAPLKRAAPPLKVEAIAPTVPLRLIANWTALSASSVERLVADGIVRAAELAAHVPGTRRQEFDAALDKARAGLKAAQAVTGGSDGLSDHSAIIAAAEAFAEALAALATVGNVFRQSLERDGNAQTSPLAAEVITLSRRVAGQGRFPYAGR